MTDSGRQMPGSLTKLQVVIAKDFIKLSACAATDRRPWPETASSTILDWRITRVNTSPRPPEEVNAVIGTEWLTFSPSEHGP